MGEVETIDEIDGELFDALRLLRADGMRGADPRGKARARQAMFIALRSGRERSWLKGLLRRPIRVRSLVVEFAVLSACAVAVLGWSAPAGSPLHQVRIVGDSITRSLSGDSSQGNVPSASQPSAPTSPPRIPGPAVRRPPAIPTASTANRSEPVGTVGDDNEHASPRPSASASSLASPTPAASPAPSPSPSPDY